MRVWVQLNDLHCPRQERVHVDLSCNASNAFFLVLVLLPMCASAQEPRKSASRARGI